MFVVFVRVCLHVDLTLVGHSGSGVELRTLDYENPGSNLGCGVLNLGQVFSLYIAPLHSTE